MVEAIPPVVPTVAEVGDSEREKSLLWTVPPIAALYTSSLVPVGLPVQTGWTDPATAYEPM